MVAVTIRQPTAPQERPSRRQIKRPSPDVFGREVARSYVYGLVAAFSLSHDRFTGLWPSRNGLFRARAYAIDVWGNKWGWPARITSGSSIWSPGEVKSCRDAWLSQSHTVQFLRRWKKASVVSSGFDAVIEFDTESGEVVWQWFAWDHGYIDRSGNIMWFVRPKKQNAESDGGTKSCLWTSREVRMRGSHSLCPAHLQQMSRYRC